MGPTESQSSAAGAASGRQFPTDRRSSPEASAETSLSRGERFVSTHWSVVLKAADSSAPDSTESLEKLCQTYWYPLYAYVRRMGSSPEDAEDLTQGFFTRFLEKKYLRSVDPGKGRFRSFLLASLKHFCAKEWRREKAEKRGGHYPAVSLDGLTAEERYRLEPADRLTAEDIYERRWAMTVLQTALERLAAECRANGKEALYEALKGALSGDADLKGYLEIGARLNLSADAVKTAVHRLRQRYRSQLRSEVANTVADSREVDQELRHLLTVLSRA